jgi:hypothetical protein
LTGGVTMSPLVLALLIAAQAADAPLRTTLSNDRPEFPIGFAKDRQLLEDANQLAIKNPIRVGGLMEEAAKKGDLLPIPSGTKAKLVATEKLRGPMFKEITQVEITEGSSKGLVGWTVSKALVTDQEYAAIGASSKAPKAAEQVYQPLYRDPVPGETVYLAPQPTMFGMVRSLTRLYRADESAAAVFKEWHEVTDAARDAFLKRLENKKAIFYTPLNTEAKVRQVFADKMTGGIYPVEVELLSGPLKGTVAWLNVANVSPVRAVRPKVDPAAEEKRKSELQTTIEHRKNRRMKVAARATGGGPSGPVGKAVAQQPNQDQMRTQMQLQMLQQQAALAEAQLANQSLLSQQLARTLRQQQLGESYRNGGGVVYGPNGEMTMDEFLRSGGGTIPGNSP